MNLSEIWDTVSEAGLTAGKGISKGAKRLSRYDREDILAAFGLEPKRSTMEVVLPAVGFFTVGVLAGIGLGMLFAPKPGYELRGDLSEQIKGMQEKAAQKAKDVAASGETNPVI